MASMKIEVNRMGDEPQELHLTLDAQWFARELEGVHHPEGEGQGKAELSVSKLGAKVQVTGQVVARFPVSCGRCLESAEVIVDEPFVMFFEPASDRPLAQDLELTAEDVHWKTFDGEEIDLAPLIREQLLLSVPMTPLCRPDCQGLSEHLEQWDPDEDESVERVEIDGKLIDPRWNALAKLKTKR
jgi:DUF177 domain-containing protein